MAGVRTQSSELPHKFLLNCDASWALPGVHNDARRSINQAVMGYALELCCHTPPWANEAEHPQADRVADSSETAGDRVGMQRVEAVYF